MNLFDGAGGEAKLLYTDADYEVLVPGAFVKCAISGVRIPLAALRYWNIEKQEAYADAANASVGFGLVSKGD